MRKTSRIAGAVAIALAALSLCPRTARAHPLIDQADSAHRAAEHRRALELLERAEAGDDLTRDDLVALLLLRARVHRSLRRAEDLEADLFRLAHLAPDLELGPDVPRSIRRQFERTRATVSGPIRANATAERVGSRARITAIVEDDVAGLATGFRIHARTEGGVWQTAPGPTLEIDAPRALAVEFWVEVLGPGGATIAQHASRDAPDTLEAELPLAPEVALSEPGVLDQPTSRDGGGEELPVWPFVLGGGVVVAGVVVLIVLLFTVPGDDSNLDPSGIVPRM